MEWPPVAVLLAAVIAVGALIAADLVGPGGAGFFPDSFVTHSVMLVCSVALAWILTGGRPGLFGFGRATYVWSPRTLLWVLPTAGLATLGLLAGGGSEGGGPATGLTRPQLVVFVGIYASVGEEALTRGLLQTLLGGIGRTPHAGRRGLGMPVLVSAFFFAAMHLVLLRSMGVGGVPVLVMAFLLGVVAGRYRERTGSLIPAVIIHALFNVGGMVPGWLAGLIGGPPA